MANIELSDKQRGHTYKHVKHKYLELWGSFVGFQDNGK